MRQQCQLQVLFKTHPVSEMFWAPTPGAGTPGCLPAAEATSPRRRYGQSATKGSKRQDVGTGGVVLMAEVGNVPEAFRRES